jgi:tetratricopeptide (TPR) repeat protein
MELRQDSYADPADSELLSILGGRPYRQVRSRSRLSLLQIRQPSGTNDPPPPHARPALLLQEVVKPHAKFQPPPPSGSSLVAGASPNGSAGQAKSYDGGWAGSPVPHRSAFSPPRSYGDHAGGLPVGDYSPFRGPAVRGGLTEALRLGGHGRAGPGGDAQRDDPISSSALPPRHISSDEWGPGRDFNFGLGLSSLPPGGVQLKAGGGGGSLSLLSGQTERVTSVLGALGIDDNDGSPAQPETARSWGGDGGQRLPDLSNISLFGEASVLNASAPQFRSSVPPANSRNGSNKFEDDSSPWYHHHSTDGPEYSSIPTGEVPPALRWSFPLPGGAGMRGDFGGNGEYGGGGAVPPQPALPPHLSSSLDAAVGSIQGLAGQLQGFPRQPSGAEPESAYDSPYHQQYPPQWPETQRRPQEHPYRPPLGPAYFERGPQPAMGEGIPGLSAGGQKQGMNYQGFDYELGELREFGFEARGRDGNVDQVKAWRGPPPGLVKGQGVPHHAAQQLAFGGMPPPQARPAPSPHLGTAAGPPGLSRPPGRMLKVASSASQHQDGRMKVVAPASAQQGNNVEDEVAVKRAELVESPTTRLAFKDFCRTFRQKEKVSFEEAKQYAEECFVLLPGKVHWRLYLELADLAKRENHFKVARKLYRKATKLQPYASQGWLEFSKLEEECGDLQKCSQLLRRGLMFCEYSEVLLIKAIKHEERMGSIAGARELLSRLKHVGIEKVWRTVLEGALLEARAGNADVARKVLKYLMTHVPWYGPIYYEAFRLEEKAERYEVALTIVRAGLEEIPRYGPLWFGAFRLCERLDVRDAKARLAAGKSPPPEGWLPRTKEALTCARDSISKELVWKVHFEAAQIEERLASMLAREALSKDGGVSAAEADNDADDQERITTLRDPLLRSCREAYVHAIVACQNNLRWKVWLAGARTELAAGNCVRARKLLRRAFNEVPEKSKSHVFLECSRLEEFLGNMDTARAILLRARQETRSEWKVFLETVMLEVRAGEWERAAEAAEAALEIHSGAGRLWAVLVQLQQWKSDAAQQEALQKALKQVPKSGEVWCEGARIHLNPLSRLFDMSTAGTYLDFAIQFTPQYGDSFMECLRLELLAQVLLPVAKEISCQWRGGRLVPPEVFASYQDDSYLLPPAALMGSVFDLAQWGGHDALPHLNDKTFLRTEIGKLQLRCVNADPNYGAMWFHCRHRPSDTARSILMMAKLMMAEELSKLQVVYLAAMVRRLRIEAEVRQFLDNAGGSIADEAMQHRRERLLLLAARVAPPVSCTDRALGDGLAGVSTEDFITGLATMNRILSHMTKLKAEQRRKILFAADQIVP